MDPEVVKARLKEVLATVQALSGETCPPINDDTRPAEELPKFTSKVWPVAAGMLGLALGKSIPCEANIFVADQSQVPLTINQTVELVIKILESQPATEGADK